MSEATHPNTELQARADAPDAGEPTPNVAPVVPPVDIYEDADGILLYADLPGVSRDRLDLRVQGDNLLIDAQASLNLPAQLQMLHVETRALRYRRAFTLSHELDAARIDASLKDGVLMLRIPRVEAARPRRIAVRVD